MLSDARRSGGIGSICSGCSSPRLVAVVVPAFTDFYGSVGAELPLLFHAGRWAIGLYLGRATQPTAYGAAASFAALLLWLYYSAQIFLFGAEFTACLGQSRKPPATGA